MKEILMSTMSIGAAFLMLWASMEYFGVSLNMGLFLVGGVHLFIGLLFYIVVAMKERENDPRRI